MFWIEPTYGITFKVISSNGIIFHLLNPILLHLLAIVESIIENKK
jgi:hypothetical protein